MCFIHCTVFEVNLEITNELNDLDLTIELNDL